MPTGADSYDYIIVGAGSSGCVLANRLSKDPANRVLLVECGPNDKSPLISMPRGIGKLLNPENPHVFAYSVRPAGNQPEEVWLKALKRVRRAVIHRAVEVERMHVKRVHTELVDCVSAEESGEVWYVSKYG